MGVSERGISRRALLKMGAGASLVLLVPLDPGFAQEVKSGEPTKPRINPVNAWLRFDSNGHVTLLMPKAEMGQGIMTSLPMLLAEELDLDWKEIRVEQAPTDPGLYRHGTGGSSSIRSSWLPLRKAAASARAMFVGAAAASWGVLDSECRTEAGAVLAQDGRKARFSELLSDARKRPVPDPESVRLKEATQFRILGTSIPRVDIPGKVDGSACFGLDVRLPGLLYAVVARCPTFGGRPVRFDSTKALLVPGVKRVFEIPPIGAGVFSAGGVAVVAENTWAAIQGRKSIAIEWDRSDGESSASLKGAMEAVLAQKGTVVRQDGDAENVCLQESAIEATYELPFVAHATMEPMNATVRVGEGSAEAWLPTQDATFARATLAKVLGLDPQTIEVHTTLMGGGFGRRSSTDFVVEAAQVSKAVGAPIQVVWTRDDDLQHDFYRPASLHRLKGVLGESGLPLAWWHRMVSTSISSFQDPPAEAKPADTEIGGAVNLPYKIQHVRMDYAPVPSRVPVSWWRSVEHSVNAFVTECFLDELAAARGIDPVDLRLRLLEEPRTMKAPQSWALPLETERLRRVLSRATEEAGWGRKLPPGRGLGVACHFSFGAYLAQIAEVSVVGDRIRVHKVTAAVDCGFAVHPDGVKAQVEGGIVYGLSACLLGRITLQRGAVEQRNFDSFGVLRIHDMPEVEVHILPSSAAPVGMGEPGVPPIAPAVANAVFAATGRRLRRLPLDLTDR